MLHHQGKHALTQAGVHSPRRLQHRQWLATEAADIVSMLGVIVALFGSTLVCGEKELVIGAVVPEFAAWKVAHLSDGVAIGISDQAVGEMILVIVLGAGDQPEILYQSQ
jgi:hypothetical protein